MIKPAINGGLYKDDVVNDFASQLRSGQVLLMDGAMGTALQRRLKLPDLVDTAACNLSEPALVHNIHADYLQAGASVLLTNTFQANPETHSHDRLQATWQAAMALARDHALPHFVLADVGPVREVGDAFVAMVQRISLLGDGVLLETWSSTKALLELAAKLDAAVPLLVSFTFRRLEGLTTFTGESPEACAKAASDAGALAIGVNCGCEIGFAEMAEIVRRYRNASDLPIFARPNAGTPIGGSAGWEYATTPTKFADGTQTLIEAGVTMIGGCCGTSPEHIAAIASHQYGEPGA